MGGRMRHAILPDLKHISLINTIFKVLLPIIEFEE